MNRKFLKLLQINTVANVGSTGKIAEEIGKAVIENGGESYIAYGRDASSSDSHLIKIGNKVDLLFHIIISRLFDKQGWASKRATKRFILKVKKISPDIVHIHNLHGYYINIPLLFNFFEKEGIRIVWTLHDCWPFTGHCAHYSFIGCQKWKVQCGNCPQIKNYPKSYYDNSYQNYNNKKRLFNSLTKMSLVCVSNWLDSQVKQSMLSNIDSRVIYNGIDLKQFKPSLKMEVINDVNVKDKFIILGVSSVWNERKGFDEFIKLSKLLDDKRYVVVLVGISEKQKRQLPSNILGINKTKSTKELAELYSTANVFVNFSFEETFGLVTVEALACGTPVIAYNSTATGEVITDDIGILINKYDLKGAINAIKEIENVEKKIYSERCIKYVEDNFDKNNNYNKYIEYYQTLIN